MINIEYYNLCKIGKLKTILLRGKIIPFKQNY